MNTNIRKAAEQTQGQTHNPCKQKKEHHILGARDKLLLRRTFISDADFKTSEQNDNKCIAI